MTQLSFEEWKTIHNVSGPQTSSLLTKYLKWCRDTNPNYPPFNPNILIGIKRDVAEKYLPQGSKYFIEVPEKIIKLDYDYGRIRIGLDDNNVITRAEIG
jgi:hypothetical protein